MKHVKIGFLAIIAILAMSFTISEQTGLFESKKPTAVTDCFKPNVTVRDLCNNANVALTSTTGCTTAQSKAGQHIFALGPGIPASQINVQCPGNTTFCCLTVEEDTDPCNGQTQFDIGAGTKFYQVKTVFCKTP